jgi:hypothetical protein
MSSDRRSMDFLSSQVKLAILRDDRETAMKYIDLMPLSAPIVRSGLSAHSLFLYRLRYRQLYSTEIASEAELNRLLAWHDRARTFGRHDEHMEVMWVALRQRHQAELASSLLSEYVRESRRERAPCQYLLRTRTAEDPVWKASGHETTCSPARAFPTQAAAFRSRFIASGC